MQRRGGTDRRMRTWLRDGVKSEPIGDGVAWTRGLDDVVCIEV